METSQLIYCANQLTGFYMKATPELNGLICYWKLRIIKNFEDSVVRILICFRVILELKTPFLIGISNVS